VANITRPGFTFGITFLPATPPQALLRVTPAPGKPGCYLYKVSTLLLDPDLSLRSYSMKELMGS
jgi:hypothetical protein